MPTIEVKDRLYSRLNNAYENTQRFLAVAESTLIELEANADRWEAEGYAYKAKEICEFIDRRLGELLQLPRLRSRTVERLNAGKQKAFQLCDNFWRRQQRHFYGEKAAS